MFRSKMSAVGHGGMLLLIAAVAMHGCGSHVRGASNTSHNFLMRGFLLRRFFGNTALPPDPRTL
jgi:hypothetical protein